MIEIQDDLPGNRAHVSALLAFAREVVAICEALNIAPVLSGSLAVLAYTRDSQLAVNDIDLACSEQDFPKLSAALMARGIEVRLKPWHVLQARRSSLKVEFDSTEHWVANLPDGLEPQETLLIGGCEFQMVGRANLIELYRRGLVAMASTAATHDAADQAKYAAILEKYRALCACNPA